MKKKKHLEKWKLSASGRFNFKIANRAIAEYSIVIFMENVTFNGNISKVG